MSGWKRVPWDSRTLGLPAYEARDPSARALRLARTRRGHYAARVDPLLDKRPLHENGFYYCDTLVAPFCRREDFLFHYDPNVRVSRRVPRAGLLSMARGAFVYGRFHRDFAVPRRLAETRYARWLAELRAQGRVFGLYDGRSLAGFIGYSGNRLVLHALARRFRARGLAKFFWSAVCRELFASGHRQITSSVSAANTAALSLYASLGFRFRDATDLYHRKTLR